jgi:hypothetical protein
LKKQCKQVVYLNKKIKGTIKLPCPKILPKVQHLFNLVGTATFGEIENGELTINIDLQGAKFSIGRESIRVLTYDDPPTGNPNFNPKLNTAREIDATETTATIVVPAANYYAINLNVTCSDEED